MSAVKALQQWCRLRCEGYRDVAITNMTTSFRDGLAFCALIHTHRPELIDFDSLKKENVYDNNKLAFKVAEEQLGIPALLDAEDMVAMKVPDRLSILTYVSQYYNYFHGRSPIGGMGGIKRPPEVATDEPPGKKNQPVVAKVFPPSKPARENSPPPSSNITRPPPSPKPSRNVTKEVPAERSHQTGTLSNKCVSCNKHVHLVQRHLVEGKLYHRNCAKSMSSTNTLTPLRDLPTNTPVSKFTPLPDTTKTSTTTPPQTTSRLGPKWLKDKPSPPSSSSTTFSPPSPSRPRSGVSSAAKVTHVAPVSKPAASRTTSESTFTTTPSIITRPVAAPRTSTTAAKTVQSKLQFFKSDSNTEKNEKHEEKKITTINVDVNKPPIVSGKVQEAAAGQAVTLVVNIGGGAVKKETTSGLDKGGDRAKAAGGGGKVNLKQEDSESNKTKAAAAVFISKKLAEENNNSSSSSNKPTWTSAAVKKPDKLAQVETPKREGLAQVETPKRETGGVRGRVKLRADPSLLADLTPVDPPAPTSAPTLAPTPATKSGLRARTPERGDPKSCSASPNTSASENESPADWRSKLKPVAKETKPAAPPATVKPWANGAGKPQTSELSVGPPSHVSTPNISVTPPPSRGSLNVQTEQTANGNKSESKTSKIKPDYIPKEDIMKELQSIEDSLDDLEKRGVELEVKLRSSEDEGEDDSVMDELMVEWFNLIRNKQVAMRRESELVYIGRTQELEEQQPSVEQELRRLMDKPEHLKTASDRKREKQLMDKLVEIVNDRNAIIDNLDEDRLREEEEDEELNKMMRTLSMKKDKPKKKSPVSKLFSWGNKKEG